MHDGSYIPTYTPSRPVQPSGKGPGWYTLNGIGTGCPATIVQKLRRRSDAPKGYAATGPYKTRKAAMQAAERLHDKRVASRVGNILGALRSITAMCNRWWIVRIFHGKTFDRIMDHAHDVLDRYDRA